MVRMRRKERLEIPDSDNVLAEVLELVLSLDLDQVSPPWTYCKARASVQTWGFVCLLA